MSPWFLKLLHTINSSILWGLMGKYLGFSCSDWRLGEIDYLGTRRQRLAYQTTITKQTHFDTQNNHLGPVDSFTMAKGWMKSNSCLVRPWGACQCESSWSSHLHTHTRTHTLSCMHTHTHRHSPFVVQMLNVKNFYSFYWSNKKSNWLFFPTVSAMGFWTWNTPFGQSHKCHGFKGKYCTSSCALETVI